MSRKKKKQIKTEDDLKLYTIYEVADILKLNPATIRNWIRSEKLKAVDVTPPGLQRKIHRIKKEELDKLIS